MICLLLCSLADEYLCGWVEETSVPRTLAYLWAGEACIGKTTEVCVCVCVCVCAYV
jgi:hypothetical protein